MSKFLGKKNRGSLESSLGIESEWSLEKLEKRLRVVRWSKVYKERDVQCI